MRSVYTGELNALPAGRLRMTRDLVAAGRVPLKALTHAPGFRDQVRRFIANDLDVIQAFVGMLPAGVGVLRKRDRP